MGKVVFTKNNTIILIYLAKSRAVSPIIELDIGPDIGENRNNACTTTEGPL